MSVPLPLPPPDQAVTLARIEIKLDQALRQLEDHEGRLRSIEARNWPKQSINVLLAGVSSVAALVAVLVPLTR